MSTSSPFMSSKNVVLSNRIIYTPTYFAKSNLMYLQEVGTLKALRIHESKRSNLSSYLVFIVLHGSGCLTVDGVVYDIKTGDCAFVDCMQNYKHNSSEDSWILQWVHFNGFNMAGIYEKYRNRGGKYVFTPSPEDFQKISTLLTDIHRIADSTSYIRDMEINEKLNGLLTELMRNSWDIEQSGAVSQKRKDLRNVREYIDTHYSEDIKLDNLADMFFVNKFYLTRIFKKQYGITINNHLTQVRITNAKKHLRFTDMTVEQIGAKCGYNDSNFFIRTFKRCEGMTPGEFRIKWKS